MRVVNVSEFYEAFFYYKTKYTRYNYEYIQGTWSKTSCKCLLRSY